VSKVAGNIKMKTKITELLAKLKGTEIIEIIISEKTPNIGVVVERNKIDYVVDFIENEMGVKRPSKIVSPETFWDEERREMVSFKNERNQFLFSFEDFKIIFILVPKKINFGQKKNKDIKLFSVEFINGESYAESISFIESSVGEIGNPMDSACFLLENMDSLAEEDLFHILVKDDDGYGNFFSNKEYIWRTNAFDVFDLKNCFAGKKYKINFLSSK